MDLDSKEYGKTTFDMLSQTLIMITVVS